MVARQSPLGREGAHRHPRGRRRNLHVQSRFVPSPDTGIAQYGHAGQRAAEVCRLRRGPVGRERMSSFGQCGDIRSSADEREARSGRPAENASRGRRGERRGAAVTPVGRSETRRGKRLFRAASRRASFVASAGPLRTSTFTSANHYLRRRTSAYLYLRRPTTAAQPPPRSARRPRRVRSAGGVRVRTRATPK